MSAQSGTRAEGDLWCVNVNGNQTIVRAETEAAAKWKAVHAFVSVSAHLATDEEIAHQRGMGGYVPA